MWKYILLGLIIFLLTACTDPKEVKKENFENIINRYLVDKRSDFACEYVKVKLPLVDEYGIYERKFKQLIDLGLISASKKSKIKKDIITRQLKNYDVYKYSLTKLGKKNLEKNKFCFGKPIVKEIISFTEPVDFMGKKVVEVKYKYELIDTPSWYFSSQNKKIKKIGLYLTNKGWIY